MHDAEIQERRAAGRPAQDRRPLQQRRRGRIGREPAGDRRHADECRQRERREHQAGDTPFGAAVADRQGGRGGAHEDRAPGGAGGELRHHHEVEPRREFRPHDG